MSTKSIPRTLAARLRGAAKRHPLVTLTGPRQSGKTTLARATFPAKPWVSLEDPDVRSFALEDPRGFLARHIEGAIFDEVQRAPELLSYLQGEVDRRPDSGRFILTGSQNFSLQAQVSQSLAGRTALLTLLPCGWDEIHRFAPETHHPKTLSEALWTGGYPALFRRNLSPREWLPDYIATYLERDVRQLLNVGDLGRFQTFVRIAAGRTGQLLNLAALAGDAGVSQPTARAWLAVLEASYLLVRLQPWSANVTSRLVKTPKLHFLDSGVTCSLLGIRTPGELESHPLRGAIFESWVISEALKWRFNRGLDTGLFFYRDRKGVEVDCLMERGGRLHGAEMKAGQTIAQDFTVPMRRAASQLGVDLVGRVVYGGADSYRRAGVEVLAWSAVQSVPW